MGKSFYHRNLSTEAESKAQFSVTALGNLPLRFQWQKNETNLTDRSGISDSATNTLTLAKLTEADNGGRSPKGLILARDGKSLVEGPDGSLYGTTTTGGPAGQGTIFRLSFSSAPQVTGNPPAKSRSMEQTSISARLFPARAPSPINGKRTAPI